MRKAGVRNPTDENLLAHGEEAIVIAPDAVDRTQAEAPAAVNVPQIRDAAVTAHARPGAESDDGELPLLLGVRVAESDEFLREAGAQPALVDLGERCVVRDVALEVDVLGLDLPGFTAHPLADLDRREGDAVEVGVDVGREPALEVAHRRDGVDDLHAEDLRELGLLGLPIRKNPFRERFHRPPSIRRDEPTNRFDRHVLRFARSQELFRESTRKSEAFFQSCVILTFRHGLASLLWLAAHPLPYAEDPKLAVGESLDTLPKERPTLPLFLKKSQLFTRIPPRFSPQKSVQPS